MPAQMSDRPPKNPSAKSSISPSVRAFYHEPTATLSYVVHAPGQTEAVIIDPVLDYDAAAARTSTEAADALLDYVTANHLTVEWILETHCHADHLTAAVPLKDKLGARLATGAHISKVQKTFKEFFHVEESFATDGSQFDLLLNDGDVLTVGALEISCLHTPGHTPSCMTYVIGDAAFVGDTLFAPDYGTARCDFPNGDARQLYHSIRRILSLPDATRLFLCHDYRPNGRPVLWETSVADQRAHNIHIHDGIDEDSFVALRTERDKALAAPALILPSVQVNMRAGHLPPAEENGQVYLKIPLNRL